LKFLPADLANDPQALTRFQREAKAASALNHPNICTIHEIDEQNGKHSLLWSFSRETLGDYQREMAGRVVANPPRVLRVQRS
jgi:serine/threonine protein kinase